MSSRRPLRPARIGPPLRGDGAGASWRAMSLRGADDGGAWPVGALRPRLAAHLVMCLRGAAVPRDHSEPGTGGEPKTNRTVERFIRTLKEQIIHGACTRRSRCRDARSATSSPAATPTGGRRWTGRGARQVRAYLTTSPASPSQRRAHLRPGSRVRCRRGQHRVIRSSPRPIGMCCAGHHQTTRRETQYLVGVCFGAQHQDAAPQNTTSAWCVFRSRTPARRGWKHILCQRRVCAQ